MHKQDNSVKDPGLDTIVESMYQKEEDIDHHNQYMMDRDLLQPLHKAVQTQGADDLNDWIIKQIKDQGDNWIEWFIDTVIGGDEEGDEEDTGRIPTDVDSFGTDS
tara:strand:- start:83 stop:397 length:315 start_codon:yes stop_codon:yes gene_type:complete